MTIYKGDSPENDGSNKFITYNGGEHRGTLIVVSPDGTQGIIDGTTDKFAGERIFVQERRDFKYPIFVGHISTIPDGFKTV